MNVPEDASSGDSSEPSQVPYSLRASTCPVLQNTAQVLLLQGNRRPSLGSSLPFWLLSQLVARPYWGSIESEKEDTTLYVELASLC